MEIITTCRLCGTPLPEAPALHLENIPPRIQYFPTAEQLATDESATLDVFQCTGCGLIQLNSAPVVYADEATSTTAYYQNMMDIRQQQAHHLIHTYDLQGATVLDVGCGDGHLLEIITAEGALAVGVDASERALALARAKGLNVHYGYITRTHQIDGAPFDAFMSTDVIEHVPDVKDFLQGVNANLKPGAVGLIETPSFEKALEDHRFYEFILDHLSYFTVETFRLALEMTGFEVLNIERNREGENLTAIVRKRPADDLNALLAYTDRLKAAFNDFMQMMQGQRVAIWGASLQALTLSSMLDLSTTAYVIDSAPYKQGRYTPVSHLPIVSPETLHTDPVYAVLIIAPRYRDEIIRQIEGDAQYNGAIAVLDGDKITIIRS
ncbi:MAG: class I SAM-dependent methyltransferase [Anaerolineae bacterium]